VRRGEIYWAALQAPAGRRPVVVLTRDRVLAVRQKVVIAEITRTVRGIASEVSVGPDDGVPHPSVVSCDNLATVPKVVLDPEPLGRLSSLQIARLDRALVYALGIRV
jgi:mRNA interferase MazF